MRIELNNDGIEEVLNKVDAYGDIEDDFFQLADGSWIEARLCSFIEEGSELFSAFYIVNSIDDGVERYQEGIKTADFNEARKFYDLIPEATGIN
jgi:hypothetical protein